MCRSHSTVTPAVVRRTAKAVLARALPLAGYGRTVTPGRLADLLLLVAALRSSLSAVARRFALGFSHETARQAVRATLPDLGRLTAGLVDALHAVGGRGLRRRRWDVALDLHYAPYYGRRGTPGVVGTRRTAGTHYAYGYATAVLLHRGARYTVGLAPVTGPARPDAVAAALLDQLAARRVRVRGVVLDSGFDSADTIRVLRRRGVWYAVPLRRKGAGANARNAWFAAPVGTVTRRAWCAKDTRRRVETWTVVRRRPGDGRVQVLAFGGWGAGRAAAAVRRRAALAGRKYRDRFGIETSYRQLNQGKGRTTAADVGYRLLLVGLGLLLRQVWVWLTAQVVPPRDRRGRGWVGALPLATVIGWLADAIRRAYPEDRAVVLTRPLPEIGG
jgi:hypothetical protein